MEDVEPIRHPEAVEAVKERLREQPRNLLLFALGVNNGLRAGELLRLTVNQIRHVAPGGSVAIRDRRSGMENILFVPPQAHQTLQEHLARLDPPPAPGNMFLFADHRGWTPLATQRLDEMVREWAHAVGLAGRYGAHTLRKTFGYIHRTVHGVGLDVLAHRFHHPSPAATARYLGLTGEVPESVVLPEI